MVKGHVNKDSAESVKIGAVIHVYPIDMGNSSQYLVTNYGNLKRS